MEILSSDSIMFNVLFIASGALDYTLFLLLWEILKVKFFPLIELFSSLCKTCSCIVRIPTNSYMAWP